MKTHLRTLLLLLAGPGRLVLAQTEFEDTRVGKAIPVEKNDRSSEPVTAYNQGGISLTVDPAVATSQANGDGVTNALVQQMRFAVIQVITPWLSLTYGTNVGFTTQDIQLLRQADQSSANLNLLNRPALAWKPRPGIEVEAAYEAQDSLTPELTSQSSGTTILQGKVQVNPQATVGLAWRDQTNTDFVGNQTSDNSVRLTTEYAVRDTPVTLQLNPGYENSTAVDGTETLRSFVENAIIWKADSATTFTFGTGFAGGRNSPFSQSGYVLVQHIILPRTALELRAAMLDADRDIPGRGFAFSAGSTVALAQALSAGLSLRYQMNEVPVIARPQNETFLTLSINGKF